MRHRFSVVIGAAAITAFAACGGGDTAEQMPADSAAAPAPTPPAEQGGGAAMALPPGVTQEMVAQGDSIFKGSGLCFTCHGPDAKGTANAPDLTDDVWINITGRNYDEIVALVNTGVAQPKQFPTPMPPKGGSTITDDQVRAAAAYVLSLGQH